MQKIDSEERNIFSEKLMQHEETLDNEDIDEEFIFKGLKSKNL
jgi:hypothetical protein